MAELNLTPAQKLSAAAAALTLGTSRRLIRNFNSYRTESKIFVEKMSLLNLCDEIRHSCFALHNLLANEQEFSPFSVTLSGDINNRLEELHRKLLYYPADAIAGIIPIVDRQRMFWKDLIETDFYNHRLSFALEHSVPNELDLIETYIKDLPDTARL